MKWFYCKILYICCLYQLAGQTSLFLLGNTADIKDKTPLEALEQVWDTLNNEKKVLLLGDVSSPEASSNLLFDWLSERKDKKDFYFITGDRDWDDSGPNGYVNATNLEKYIKKELDFKKAFYPGDGCPGPKTIDLDDETVLVLLNSQWFIHPYDRPEAPDTECKIIVEADFWEELEDVLEDEVDKRILLAAHHPIYSGGQFAGYKMGYRHLLPPLFGTLYLSYRKESGSPADMAYDPYRSYIRHLEEILKDYPNVIYLSGHESDIQVLQRHGNYHLNSGAIGEGKAVAKRAGTLYRQKQPGWIQLDLLPGGKMHLKAYELRDSGLEVSWERSIKNQYLQDSTAFEHPITDAPDFKPQDSVNAIAGIEYAASKFQKWLMGEHYRDEWTATVRVPVLNIREKHGGLIPFGTGSGMQTLSLKFRAADGQEYAFRSINKDPVRSLNPELKNTVAADVLKDLVSVQHPYGALMIAPMLDHTDILHARPELYAMPDDPALGPYRETFAGRLGMLEDRPKGPKGKRKGFAGADDILKSYKFFGELYKDNDNRIDRFNYAKSRIFDLWVGDRDRHADNWKWAAFKDDGLTIYKPLPRDRDFAIPLYEGLLPSLADFFVINLEAFGINFTGMKSLSYNARFLDRQLGNELTRSDWLAAANYLQGKMTDEVILEGVNNIPPEVRSISGEEIIRKLQSRRAQLPLAASQLYDLLAREVDVVGSNKREIFNVERMADGQMKVTMYDRKKETGEAGKLIYQRTFNPKDTREVRLFGLGGRDEFFIEGSSETGPLLRVIGGRSEDSIVDQSEVRSGRKKTQVYDTKAEDRITKGKETKIRTPKNEARYDNEAFMYSAPLILPKFRVSSGSGFGADLELGYFKRGFNKPLYAQMYQAKIIFYSINTNRLDLRSRFRYLLGLWDAELHLRMAGRYDKVPYFYGVGNTTPRSDELDRNIFNRIVFNTVRFMPSIDRTLLGQAKVKLGLNYEYNNVERPNHDISIFDDPAYADLTGRGQVHYGGFNGLLDLDFRNNPEFATSGAQWMVSYQAMAPLGAQTEGGFGKFETNFSYFYSVGRRSFLTFAAKARYGFTHGDAPFYYLSSLGSGTDFRGLFRNRYLGTSAANFNGEIRLHLGTIPNPVVPIKWGIYGFSDVGRVWYDEEADNDIWHRSVGAGIYAAPFKEDYNINVFIARSDDDDFYFKIRLGFDLE